MVNDAEVYRAEEDDKQRERIQAKNSLESYAFNMKSSLEDEKLKDKISAEDKEAITEKCGEVISWMDSNQVAEKEEFEHQQKELEGVCMPIITKMYQAAGGAPGGTPGGPPGGMPSDMPGGMPDGMSGGVPDGMPGGMPNGDASGAGASGNKGPTIEELD